MIDAKIIADSRNPIGNRITTWVLKFPRFILSEFNTHRVLSRNSSSSRARPLDKTIQDVLNDPAIPEFWGKNQKGMQASVELNEKEREAAKTQWLYARDLAVHKARMLQELDVHKQIANRLLEPWMHQTVLCTATEWQNFFALRAHKDCYSDDTEVLTLNGWQKFDDVKIGDLVYTLDDDQNLITTRVKNVIQDYYHGEMLYIKGQSVDLLTTPNHKHYASLNRNCVDYKLYNQEDIIKSKRVAFYKTCKENRTALNKDLCFQEYNVKQSNQYHKNYVKYTIPSKFIDKKKFMRFLGFYLGDGNCIEKTKEIILYCANKDEQKYYTDIAESLYSNKPQLSFKDGTYYIRFRNLQLYELLLPLGKAKNKYIPNWIFDFKSEFLIELFYGLIDSDGSFSYKNDYTKGLHYTTISKQLADDLQRLCLLIGKSASIQTIDRVGEIGGIIKGRQIINKHIVYSISINQSKNNPRIKTLIRNGIQKTFYSGKIVCLELEDYHKLYVRRNGKCVWSGNSQPEFQRLAFKMLDLYNSNEPKQLKTGEWHIPFGDKYCDDLTVEEQLKVCTARAARVSYNNFEGDIDFKKDFDLHNRLLESGHLSPFEHCAQALNYPGTSGNFIGWYQYRKLFHNENRKDERIKHD